jgi:hypothetical protein
VRPIICHREALGRQVLDLEALRTWAAAGNGGLIQASLSSVTTIWNVGPSTTMIGAGVLPADGMLEDVAPAIEVLEAALAAGAWTRITCTWWWAAFWTSARAIGRSSPV